MVDLVRLCYCAASGWHGISLLPTAGCLRCCAAACAGRTADKTATGLTYIPAPKLKLPGHEESYNPPKEYIPTEVCVCRGVGGTSAMPGLGGLGAIGAAFVDAAYAPSPTLPTKRRALTIDCRLLPAAPARRRSASRSSCWMRRRTGRLTCPPPSTACATCPPTPRSSRSDLSAASTSTSARAPAASGSSSQVRHMPSYPALALTLLPLPRLPSPSFLIVMPVLRLSRATAHAD